MVSVRSLVSIFKSTDSVASKQLLNFLSQLSPVPYIRAPIDVRSFAQSGWLNHATAAGVYEKPAVGGAERS